MVSAESLKRLPHPRSAPSTKQVSKSHAKPLYQTKRLPRFYSESAPKQGDDVELLRPDFTAPDYGLENVTLDSQAYFKAFGETSHFESGPDAAWMLWAPPKDLIHPEEWELAQKKNGAAQVPSGKNTIGNLMLLMSSQLSNGKKFGEGAYRAYLSTTQHIDSGKFDLLEDALDPATFNYVGGWLEYLKQRGYTYKHSVDKIEMVVPTGITAIVTTRPQAKDGEDLEPIQNIYKDGPHLSMYGSPQDPMSHVAAFAWAKMAVRESWAILDKDGKVVLDSPSSLQHHIWKFGATSTVAGVQYDALTAAGQSMDGEWEFKLYDINHQIVQRSAEILTKQKLFLDADAPRWQAWQMLRAF